ncbi:hypothetical protein KQX54_009779 [Cotesia glomerata]|uniref:Uncharacterized protein n=1 Tax=Cotesia glomerata TaxID=32391 RepID=A0AAV7IV85_COTGL|nr:hypothetical protein KQX54_009779 [Cotesia glomerata]
MRSEVRITGKRKKTQEKSEEKKKKSEDEVKKQEIMDQLGKMDQKSQKYNFSVLPRNTHPIAMMKFRNVSKGKFLETDAIDKTRANYQGTKKHEKTTPNLDPTEEKLKDVLEKLKTCPDKKIQEKRKIQVIDTVHPATKRKRFAFNYCF